MLLALQSGWYQPINAPTVLNYLLPQRNEFGKAGVQLRVPYYIGTCKTPKEALHKGQVRHALLASATAWKLSQHSLDTLVVCFKKFTRQQSQ
jgi:hypothetical protein